MAILGGWEFLVSEIPLYRGTSLISKSHTPQGFHMVLGIVLL